MINGKVTLDKKEKKKTEEGERSSSGGSGSSLQSKLAWSRRK